MTSVTGILRIHGSCNIKIELLKHFIKIDGIKESPCHKIYFYSFKFIQFFFQCTLERQTEKKNKYQGVEESTNQDRYNMGNLRGRGLGAGQKPDNKNGNTYQHEKDETILGGFKEKTGIFEFCLCALALSSGKLESFDDFLRTIVC